MKKLLFPLLLLYMADASAQTSIAIPDNATTLSEIRQHASQSNIIGSKVRLAHPLTQADGNWGIDTRGGSLWKMTFDASVHTDALLVYFDELIMPEGATISVATSDGDKPLATFDPPPNSTSHAYALPYVSGHHAVVTIHLPKGTENQLSIRISEIGCLVSANNTAGGTSNRGTAIGFGQSQSCFANVACTEGNGYTDASRAVARYIYPSGSSVGACSGSLVNTTNGACKDYFLSASHCMINSTAAEQAQAVFYFNYQSPTCTNPASETGLNTQTVTGCQIRAISGTPGTIAYGSDFVLLELNPVPASYNVFYAGWDRTGGTGISRDSGAIIQHPWGDIKKIALYDTIQRSNTLLGVIHHQTANGNASNAPGSSGSPVFNKLQRIVGTVSEGSNCLVNGRGGSSGGTIAGHWDQNGSTAAKQLAPWLDATGTGAMSINGRNACGVTTTAINNVGGSAQGGLQLYPVPAGHQLYVVRAGTWAGGKATATLVSITGALLGNYSLNDGGAPTVLSLGDYPAGVYLLKVRGDGWATAQQFVKQ